MAIIGNIVRQTPELHDQDTGKITGYVNPVTGKEVYAYQHKYQAACSDLTTALEITEAAVVFRSQSAFEAREVRASLKTASSSGAVTIDITMNGTTMLSTKITIDANERTSLTASVPAVISVPDIPDDAEFIVKIDGAGTGAMGLVVSVLGL